MSSVDGPARPVIVEGTATGAFCRHGHARWRGYRRHLHRLLPVGRGEGGAAQPQGPDHAADAGRRAAARPRPAAGTPRRPPVRHHELRPRHHGRHQHRHPAQGRVAGAAHHREFRGRGRAGAAAHARGLQPVLAARRAAGAARSHLRHSRAHAVRRHGRAGRRRGVGRVGGREGPGQGRRRHRHLAAQRLPQSGARGPSGGDRRARRAAAVRLPLERGLADHPRVRAHDDGADQRLCPSQGQRLSREADRGPGEPRRDRPSR